MEYSHLSTLCSTLCLTLGAALAFAVQWRIHALIQPLQYLLPYFGVLQVTTAALDKLKEVPGHGGWKYSAPFFCSGYIFKICIGREDFQFAVGIFFEGAALSYMLEDSHKNGVFADMDLMKVTAKCCANQVKHGILHASDRFPDKQVYSNSPKELLYTGKISYDAFPELSKYKNGPKLSQILDNAGYLMSDNHLHLTAKISLLSKGFTRQHGRG